MSAVGYTTKALDGLEFVKGAIKNDEGRVLNASGEPIEGLYCVGWARRGPSGVIGTNKHDACDVVEKVLADITAHGAKGSGVDLDATLIDRGIVVVNLGQWRKIDEAELSVGESSSRPRVKFVSTDEMLRAAGQRD